VSRRRMDTQQRVIAGVAGLVAGPCHGAGEYVSVHSQTDTEQADLALSARSDAPPEVLLADVWTFANWLRTRTRQPGMMPRPRRPQRSTCSGWPHLSSSGTSAPFPSNAPTVVAAPVAEEGWREDLPEIAWERPACEDCGWAGRLSRL